MVFFCTGIFRYRLFIQTWQTLKVGEQTNNDRILWYEHLTSRIMQLCIQACAHVEGCHIEEMSQNDPLRRGQTSHRCHFNLHLHLHLPKSHSVICLLNEIWSSRKQYALGTVALTEFAGDFHGFFSKLTDRTWTNVDLQRLLEWDWEQVHPSYSVSIVFCCSSGAIKTGLAFAYGILQIYHHCTRVKTQRLLLSNCNATYVTQTHLIIPTYQQSMWRNWWEKKQLIFWWNLTLHPKYWLTILDVFFQDRSKKKKKLILKKTVHS